jgi:hypothetical protein
MAKKTFAWAAEFERKRTQSPSYLTEGNLNDDCSYSETSLELYSVSEIFFS